MVWVDEEKVVEKWDNEEKVKKVEKCKNEKSEKNGKNWIKRKIKFDCEIISSTEIRIKNLNIYMFQTGFDDWD